MKHNRDPESKPKLQAAQGKLIWEPPKYPGPCFDLHFDRFDGFIFEAEKPFENVCATGASPVGRLAVYSLITERNIATGEAPCGAHVFEGFFGLENGPVKSDKSQEKTLFGKEMPEDASRHPKPTSYPQTRQDTVVGVFPMESSN